MSKAANQPARICIVEDDPIMKNMVGDYLRQHNMRVVSASGPREMIEHLAAGELDLVILDLRLWCKDRTLELQREFDDTAAELMLRGEEPPFDAVRDETAALADEAARDVSTHGGANRARLRARIRELLTQGRGRPTQ
jgi:DNA-binding response OmpR family regulator